MFTLKLYRNGMGAPNSRCVILECAGIWDDSCENGVHHIHAFPKEVGVGHDGTIDCYVGGDLPPQLPPDSAITRGDGGNYYDWGVLENAAGKTTQMIR